MASLIHIARSTLTALVGTIGSRPELVPDPDIRVKPSDDATFVSSPFSNWIGWANTPHDRVKEMKFYDYLEREMADVRKALDAYATMACTGNLAGGGLQTFRIRQMLPQEHYPPQLLERFRRMERMFQRHSYTIVRTMCKYGSYMPAVVVTRLGDSRLGVDTIKHVPPGTIFRNVGKNGKVDPRRFWVQKIDGIPTNNDGKDQDDLYKNAIPQWVLPHFAIWSNTVSATTVNLYGVSILQPFGPIGLKVHSMLDAAVVSRLTRATMKYVYKIDVHDLKGDQGGIKKRLMQWAEGMKRSSGLFDNSMRTESMEKPGVPDNDIFLPAGQGLEYDIDKIDGDTNLARVGDIELLTAFYFGALGVPPEYLGHQRSQGGRSNLSQVDIQFARQARHIQLYAAGGFEQIAYVDMILGGWDPAKYPIEVEPPRIGARDDLLQAQIRSIQANIVGTLRKAGMRLEVKPRWILETFLHLTEELEDLSDDEINDMFASIEEMEAVSGQNDDSGSASGGDESIERVKRIVMEHHGDEIREAAARARELFGPADGRGRNFHRQHQPDPAELASSMGIR